MRRIAALETGLALVLAFFVAPFQHVHSGADHDHAGIMHAHFFHVHTPPDVTHGPQLDDIDDDHNAVWSLDTFTLVLTTGLAPFIPSWGPAVVFVPTETFQPVAVVEERGHDPPSFDRTIPRAPPV